MVAAKVVEQTYGRAGSGTQSNHPTVAPAHFGAPKRDQGGALVDEGLVLLATAQLIARARSIVGTLTSNYGLLLHDLAARHWGSDRADFRDLDNNSYYSCNVRVEPPLHASRARL